ncbi:CHAT domain-containing protein [Kitasatospora kifunensis]|uniref:CHAT domain-containing protein n=1 Tax=Kitasatospora kifunensis TaxID=58351 RepID=A0A7W7RA47_KITKI|nr:CHAT domain-containing protein [Kitasatospora kifunensis]MBB4927566.1 hypothetical protein [Kitasatospora kifunensis]
MTESQNLSSEDHFNADGGIDGVRLWAASAAERAELLLLPDPAAPPRPAPAEAGSRDQLIGELTQLEGLLGATEALRPVLAARLGGLLGGRYLHQGESADRERAIRLLREARSGTPALSRWEAQRAALMLALLLMPLPQSPAGGRRDFAAVLDFQAANGDALHPKNPDLAEVHTLLTELDGGPWPAEIAQKLGLMRMALGLAAGGTDEFLAGFGSLLDALPPDFPFRGQLNVLRDFIPEPGQGPAEAQPAPEPDPAAEREQDERIRALLLATVDLSVPGSLSREQAGELADLVRSERLHRPDDPDAAAPDAMTYAALQVSEALREHDLGSLAEAIERLRHTGERLSPASDWHPYLTALGPMALTLSRTLGGNLQDQQAAEQQLAAVLEQLGQGSTLTPGSATIAQLFVLMLRANRLGQEEDTAGLEQCLAELLTLREAGLKDEALAMSGLVLGQIYQRLGQLRGDAQLMETGMDHTIATAQAMAPVADGLGLLEPWLTGLTAVQAGLTQDPELLRERLDAPVEERPTGALGQHVAASLHSLAHAVQAELTGDHLHLDRAIAELTAVRESARQRGGGFGDADLLWSLADLHRRRDNPELDDQAHAAQAMVESFEALAADVLLEAGAEHRLLTARDGASRALQAAWWAGSRGQAERAVTMLELGRSMVLQATAAAAELPELLAARGHPELADAWRQTATGTAAPTSVPSRLRRQALDALGYGAGSGPFEPATLAELNAGLRPSKADALVYLLPGAGTAPGLAIVLGPDRQPGVLALPLLAADQRAPLEHYLDVCAERSRLLEADPERRLPAVEARWEQALSELADWALPAAVGPVLRCVAELLESNPEADPEADPDRHRDRHRGRSGGPRLVLVPCGNLGVVPWHAARLPAGDPHRYVCEFAVLSYAASGREFLRAAARERLAPGGRAVLVADPRLDLARAEQEVLALRAGCYPDAELYGEYYELTDPPLGAGTPEELLTLLPDARSAARRPVSVLHIASHGSAGVRPTVSALNLAVPTGSSPVPPGAPDAGMLTVSRLLDRPATGVATATAGPLVVLSACETDLSTRDHDEALTLATAFLTAGAKDVVGSRWTTRDGASALMMAVFHHHLAVHGRSPADALQAAQRWMLDPGRTAPPGLGPELLREIGQPQLDQLPVWAAFVHQGHPGAAAHPEKEAEV